MQIFIAIHHSKRKKAYVFLCFINHSVHGGLLSDEPVRKEQPRRPKRAHYPGHLLHDRLSSTFTGKTKTDGNVPNGNHLRMGKAASKAMDCALHISDCLIVQLITCHLVSLRAKYRLSMRQCVFILSVP